MATLIGVWSQKMSKEITQALSQTYVEKVIHVVLMPYILLFFRKREVSGGVL